MGLILFKLSELTGFRALKHYAIIKCRLHLSNHEIIGNDYHCIFLFNRDLKKAGQSSGGCALFRRKGKRETKIDRSRWTEWGLH